MKRGLLPVLAVTLLVAGCSKNESGSDLGACSAACPQCCGPDLSGPAPDSGPCGPASYPCGPYGARTGEIAEDLDFLGYQDPDEQCKEHSAKQLDTSKLASISFKQFYLGDAAKSCKRKLLWVMVSAGWCSPCKVEVPKVEADYAAGKIDSRVAVLNLVFETETKGELPDMSFLLAWINAFTPKLSFPVAMDPTFKMGAYFEKSKVPFNMLVGLDDMKIYYQQTGGDIANMYSKISAFLNQ